MTIEELKQKLMAEIRREVNRHCKNISRLKNQLLRIDNEKNETTPNNNKYIGRCYFFIYIFVQYLGERVNYIIINS